MYSDEASQVVVDSGQHCCAATAVLLAQVEEVQSWTAPNVCPVSWATTSHSVAVRATTFAPLTVSEPPVEVFVLIAS